VVRYDGTLTLEQLQRGAEVMWRDTGRPPLALVYLEAHLEDFRVRQAIARSRFECAREGCTKLCVTVPYCSRYHEECDAHDLVLRISGPMVFYGPGGPAKLKGL